MSKRPSHHHHSNGSRGRGRNNQRSSNRHSARAPRDYARQDDSDQVVSLFNQDEFISGSELDIRPCADALGSLPPSYGLFASIRSSTDNTNDVRTTTIANGEMIDEDGFAEYPSPHSHREKSSGMDGFVTPGVPMISVIKRHVTDFIVQEIHPCGAILSLNTPNAQQLPAVDSEHVENRKKRKTADGLLNDDIISTASQELVASLGDSDNVKDDIQRFFAWLSACSENQQKRTEISEVLTQLKIAMKNDYIDNVRQGRSSNGDGDSSTNHHQDSEEDIPAAPKTWTITRRVPANAAPLTHNNQQIPLSSETISDNAESSPTNGDDDNMITIQETYNQTGKDLLFREISQLQNPPFIFHSSHEYDKGQRTALHQIIRNSWGQFLASDTKPYSQLVTTVDLPPLHTLLATKAASTGDAVQDNQKEQSDPLLFRIVYTAGRSTQSDVDRRSLSEQQWLPGQDRRFLHFTLEKSDYDTLSAIQALSRALRVNPQSISSAGIKDRRGVTTQRLSVHKVTATRLLECIREHQQRFAMPPTTNYDEFYKNHPSEKETPTPAERFQSVSLSQNSSLVSTSPSRRVNYGTTLGGSSQPNFNVGDFSYESAPLRSGLLSGNHFNLVVSNIRSPSSLSPNKHSTSASIPTNSSKEEFQQIDKKPSAHLHNISSFDEYIDFVPQDLLVSLKSILQGAHNLPVYGFLNYFGEQRFGRLYTTHLLGHAYLSKNYKRLIELLLCPTPGERADLRDAKEHLLGYRIRYHDEPPRTTAPLTTSSDVHLSRHNRRGGNREISTVESLQQEQQSQESIALSTMDDNTKTADSESSTDANRIKPWNVPMASFLAPAMFSAEHAILKALQRFNPRDLYNIAHSISHDYLSFYSHAYQSYIWNNIATLRFNAEFMGVTSQYDLLRPMVGDVVLVEAVAYTHRDNEKNEKAAKKESKQKKSSQTPDAKVATSESSSTDAAGLDQLDDGKAMSHLSKVKVLTQDDIDSNKYSLSDVILPLPGPNVTYPQHKAGRIMLDALYKDGLLVTNGNDPQSSNRVLFEESSTLDKAVPITLNGVYRSLVKRPSDLDWSISLMINPTPSSVSDGNTPETAPSPSDDKVIRKITMSPMTSGGDNSTPCQFGITYLSQSNDVIDKKHVGTIDEIATTVVAYLESQSPTPQYKLSSQLSFSLDPSTYATVLLRELLKQTPVTY